MFSGFLFDIDSSIFNLCLTGFLPNNLTYELKKGWNLVGYPAFTTHTTQFLLTGVPYDMVYGYDKDEMYNIMKLESINTITTMRGFWVHVTEDYIWEYQIY